MINQRSANPFVIAAALDVLEGRCVRLSQGVREQVTIEGGDPEAAARRFADDGAPWLHLVDLDGAFSGTPSPGLLERVVAAAGEVPVQVGGGYRTLEAVERALAAGASRVLVGTAAAGPEFLAEAAPRFGEGLVVAVDVRDGHVALEGWTTAAPLTPTELVRRCAEAGVARLLVTNVRRDGSMEGPDLGLLEEVLAASSLPVLAAGGISGVENLRRLRALGCEGAVLGSALWLGRITLAEALRL
jgi:phosphoribosylformimino-5-aminoimidazole carboxamide ribotide isomerase